MDRSRGATIQVVHPGVHTHTHLCTSTHMNVHTHHSIQRCVIPPTHSVASISALTYSFVLLPTRTGISDIICVCTHLCIYAHIYFYTHVDIYTHIYIYVYIHLHIYIYFHTHICKADMCICPCWDFVNLTKVRVIWEE